jgi:predicted ATP-dependent Lon-type protease
LAVRESIVRVIRGFFKHRKVRPTWIALLAAGIQLPFRTLEQGELAEVLEFALEGRRRVKEQLKKMGSFRKLTSGDFPSIRAAIAPKD